MQIQKLGPLVHTTKLEEVKAFYQTHFDFEVTFDGAGYLGLKAKGNSDAEIGFMTPCDSSDASFEGKGLTFSLLVDDVDGEHARLTKAGLKVEQPPKDNPWGDRSFVVTDPVGVYLYLYKMIPPAPEFEKYIKE